MVSSDRYGMWLGKVVFTTDRQIVGCLALILKRERLLNWCTSNCALIPDVKSSGLVLFAHAVEGGVMREGRCVRCSLLCRWNLWSVNHQNHRPITWPPSTHAIISYRQTEEYMSSTQPQYIKSSCFMSKSSFRVSLYVSYWLELLTTLRNLKNIVRLFVVVVVSNTL